MHRKGRSRFRRKKILSQNCLLLVLFLYFFIQVSELFFQQDLLGNIVSNAGDGDIFSSGISDNRP